MLRFFSLTLIPCNIFIRDVVYLIIIYFRHLKMHISMRLFIYCAAYIRCQWREIIWLQRLATVLKRKIHKRFLSLFSCENIRIICQFEFLGRRGCRRWVFFFDCIIWVMLMLVFFFLACLFVFNRVCMFGMVVLFWLIG